MELEDVAEKMVSVWLLMPGVSVDLPVSSVEISSVETWISRH